MATRLVHLVIDAADPAGLAAFWVEAAGRPAVAPFPGGDLTAEAARLRAAGAVAVDVGQGGASWIVPGDPEGNEFCVLTPR